MSDIVKVFVTAAKIYFLTHPQSFQAFLFINNITIYKRLIRHFLKRFFIAYIPLPEILA
jgi:hypothetical protein